MHLKIFQENSCIGLIIFRAKAKFSRRLHALRSLSEEKPVPIKKLKQTNRQLILTNLLSQLSNQLTRVFGNEQLSYM